MKAGAYAQGVPPADEKVRMKEDDAFAPDDFMYGASVAHCSPAIRNGFLRKVYGLLTSQLLATAALSCAFMFHAPSRQLVLGTPSLLLVSLVASFGFLFACHAYKDSHPSNLALLGGFTLSIGYSVAYTCAAFQANGMGQLVLQAFLLTAAITVGLSVYTLKSSRDFSFLGAGLHGALGVLIVGGLLNILVGWLTGGALFHGAFSFVLGLLGAVIFSAFMCEPRAHDPSTPRARARPPPSDELAFPPPPPSLPRRRVRTRSVYDTWLISQRLGPDQYVQATIALYLDVVNLFLELLRILQYLNDGGRE